MYRVLYILLHTVTHKNSPISFYTITKIVFFHTNLAAKLQTRVDSKCTCILVIHDRFIAHRK